MTPQNLNPHRKSGMIMLGIAWIIIFALAYWFFNSWDNRQANPNTSKVLSRQNGELNLVRNSSGHYVAEGTINDQDVIFLVDTGATQVAISERLAKKMSLIFGRQIAVQTANGAAIAYQTRIDKIHIGPIEIRDVAAIVTGNMNDDTVLLGMSFLKRLEFTQRGNHLILKPAG